MPASSYQEIRESLRQLYQDDPRPWLVGFSGGKDSTLVAALVFDAVLSIPLDQRKKPVTVLCTDTRVEIPAIAEGVESALDRMRRCSQQNNLNIEAQLLKPPPEQSFWVNIIGRGYPPPNRIFRWCTQRLKIDPVTTFVQQRLSNGHWSEAILHLGARRAESSTRAQTMAGREKRNGLNRHPDLPRVWVSNPSNSSPLKKSGPISSRPSSNWRNRARTGRRTSRLTTRITPRGIPKNHEVGLRRRVLFLALLNDRDAAHKRAVAVSRTTGLTLVTTEFVLMELADALCKAHQRDEVLALWNVVETDPAFRLIRVTTELIQRGKKLYRERPDKEWPLTDCISFVVM